MTKAELIAALEARGYKARPELQVAELKLILEGFEAQDKAASLEGIVGDMQAELNTLGKQAEKAPKTVIAKLGKDEYEVLLHAFILPGHGKVTAEQLAANKELLEAVLKLEDETILKKL